MGQLTFWIVLIVFASAGCGIKAYHSMPGSKGQRIVLAIVTAIGVSMIGVAVLFVGCLVFFL